jgi:3-phosphoshikimate 1-carboxyvinyltransferase
VPGDKSISHRAVLFAPLADGACRATGWLDADDTRRSRQAIHDLGARTELRDGVLTVWPGVFPAGAATGVPLALDCGNSGTTARLLIGLLAGLRGDVIVTGDASLRARPMQRVVEPLRAMGAEIDYLEAERRLPVRIRGCLLRGRRHRLPVASAQVKSALLLAGLAARGRTEVTGAAGCRDHTERLLASMGAQMLTANPGAGGGVSVGGMKAPLRPFDLAVPGDPSSAAFLLCAAAMIPGSAITVDDMLLNPTRTGFLDLLRRAGAVVEEGIEPTAWPAEPHGAVTVRAAPLRPIRVDAAEVPGSIDELPVLAVLATQADGETVVTGARELRVKECDRISAMARELGRLGARITELPDGWRIVGPTPLRTPAAARGARGPHVVVTEGDHRVAMALAVAGLVSEGAVVLDDPDCPNISYPGFLADLAGLAGGPGGAAAEAAL